MPLHRRHDKRFFALNVFLLCLGADARSQTSADLTLASEYAGRGIALDTRPALQLRIEHDADGGWYGGGFASPVRLDGRARSQLIAYGGRARRLTSALAQLSR